MSEEKNNLISVHVFLYSGKVVHAWLDVKDHGHDLRFYDKLTNKEIDCKLIKAWTKEGSK